MPTARILIAEDEPVIAEGLKQRLVKMSYKGTKTIYTNAKTIPGADKRITADISELIQAFSEIRKINTELKKTNADLIQEIAERKKNEIKLLYQATHDSLTGLPNRDLLFDRLKQTIAFSSRHHSLLALMLIDLDNFKNINDTMGHLSGDLILKDVARRLQQCVRQYDTVARLSGDEFVVIATDMKQIHDITKFAEKVRDSFVQPFEIFGQSTRVTCSIGVGVYPLDDTNEDTLLKFADFAMYQAKKEGKNDFRFFGDVASPVNDKNVVMNERLSAALTKEEFLPHYQPRIDTASGKITGMEVLLRWQPWGVPLLYPADFFPKLEESGLVVPVGEWLLEKVCRQAKTWQDAGLTTLCMAVKVSARQFIQDNFSEKVTEILSVTGLDPRYLKIELTEKIIMNDVEDSLTKLRKLRDIGITISVDNFGIGSISLGSLYRLPIDELKIDRSFVNRITSDLNEAMVVSAAIAMGHSLGKMIVAEGVESVDQYKFLARQRCEEMQGYFFSRPLPYDEFEHLVRLESPLAGTWH